MNSSAPFDLAALQHIKQAVLPVVSQNPAWRKACFQAKRSITPKIGQLTSSAEAITRIITQLDQLLSSLKPPAGPAEPYTWTLNHLAKSLVKQAETEVTAKLSTAYPLGRVVIGLLARGHTELGDVLMARLVKKCFWLTGYWPAKQSVSLPPLWGGRFSLGDAGESCRYRPTDTQGWDCYLETMNVTGSDR